MCEKVETKKCLFCQLTEHLDSLAQEFKSSETGKHLKNAGHEFFLAIRSFVDETICRKKENELQKVTVE
jgi:hypothetical protein